MAYRREYYYKNHERERMRRRIASWRQQGINITVEEWKALIVKQNNRCAICSRHGSEFKNKLAVDHDHKTGRIRGLLCFACNRYLVQIFEKYTDLLPKVQDYINGKEHNDANQVQFDARQRQEALSVVDKSN